MSRTDGHVSTDAQMTGLLRGFRNPVQRELARRAYQDGWDFYTRPGGHVDAVNPANDAVVRLSRTGYSGAGVDRLKRHEFQAAGLDLRPKSERRREARLARARAAASAVLAAPPPAPPVGPGIPDGRPTEEQPMQQQLVVADEHRPPPPGKGQAHARFTTGATVFVSDEIAVIAGERIRIRLRADGQLSAWTPPEAGTDTRKSFSVGARDLAKQPRAADDQRRELEAKVRQWVADGKPPRKVQPNRNRKMQQEAAMPATNGAMPQPVGPGRLDEQPLTPAPKPGAAVWTTARVDPAEFPIAVALAELERSVQPAIAALEAAGKIDAAQLLRSELANTPAEAELLRLWQELTERPRLEHGAAPTE